MKTFVKFELIACLAIASFSLSGCETAVGNGSAVTPATISADRSSDNSSKNGRILSTLVKSRQQTAGITITSGPQSGQIINLATYETELDVNPADLSGDTLAAGSNVTITAVRSHSSGSPGPYTVPVSATLYERIAIDRLEDGVSKK